MRKKQNKPKTLRQKLEFAAVTVGVIFAHIVIMPVVIVLVFFYHYYVVRPITRAVETEPLYWLNWKYVKRKSQKKTSSVLFVLCNDSRPGGVLDVQFRSELDVKRLEKFLKRKRPSCLYPLMPDDVIFYEFRLKAGGPPKRFWDYIPSFQMQRPTYAHA